MAGPWRIITDEVTKEIRNLRFNTQAKTSYETFVSDVSELGPDDNPRRFSTRKARLGKDVWGCDLSKSMRLVYRIDVDKKLFILVGLGDHKTIWGRD